MIEAVAKAQVSGTSPIVTSPSALVLQAQKGQTAVGTLSLKKSSTDQHTYYLSTNQSWVWMNPPYGSTQTISSETDQLVITAQTANLSAGAYSAVIYIIDSGPNNFNNMLRIPVTLTVTATPVLATPPPPAGSHTSTASCRRGTATAAAGRGHSTACSARRFDYGYGSQSGGLGIERGEGSDCRRHLVSAQRRNRSTHLLSQYEPVLDLDESALREHSKHLH